MYVDIYLLYYLRRRRKEKKKLRQKERSTKYVQVTIRSEQISFLNSYIHMYTYTSLQKKKKPFEVAVKANYLFLGGGAKDFEIGAFVVVVHIVIDI